MARPEMPGVTVEEPWKGPTITRSRSTHLLRPEVNPAGDLDALLLIPCLSLPHASFLHAGLQPCRSRRYGLVRKGSHGAFQAAAKGEEEF